MEYRMFRKSNFICLLLLFTLGFTQDVFASHFRFGHTTWKKISTEPDGSIVVQFDSTQAWRASGLDILGIDFGDGDSHFPSNPDITNVLTTTDIAGESYTIRTYTVQHTYQIADITSNLGRFLASQESCCRISSLVNAGGSTDERIEILVDLNGGNTGSPVSTIPVIVQFAFGQTNSLQIAAADPDSDPIACRMATSAESEIPSLASTGGNDLTVGSNCLLQWDLTPTTLANVGDKYAAQVVLEETNRCVDGICGKVALDFIIEVVEGNPPVCTSSVPVNNTLFAGVPFNATFTGTDIDAGDTLTFTILGAPAAATLNPASGTVQAAPMNATLSWTPTDADKNTAQAVLVSFQDQNGLQGTCGLSLFVSPNNPDPQCTETDIQSSQFILDGTAFHQLGLLKATLKKYKNAGGSTSAAKAILAQGKNAYTSGWTATWTIPSKQFACLNTISCVTVSNTSELSDYVSAVEELAALIKKTAKKYKKAAKNSGNFVTTKPIIAESNGLVDDALGELSQIPNSSDQCPTVPQA